MFDGASMDFFELLLKKGKVGEAVDKVRSEADLASTCDLRSFPSILPAIRFTLFVRSRTAALYEAEKSKTA